jgi:hypothetical protein
MQPARPLREEGRERHGDPRSHRSQKVENDEDHEEASASVAGFRAAYVFDVSQTDGRELPRIGIVQGQPRAARRAVAASRCFPANRKQKSSLRLRANWPMSSCTEAIDAAPHLLESAKPKRRPIAFVVCHAIGLEIGSAACDYIQMWNGYAQLLTASVGHVRQLPRKYSPRSLTGEVMRIPKTCLSRRRWPAVPPRSYFLCE